MASDFSDGVCASPLTDTIPATVASLHFPTLQLLCLIDNFFIRHQTPCWVLDIFKIPLNVLKLCLGHH